MLESKHLSSITEAHNTTQPTEQIRNCQIIEEERKEENRLTHSLIEEERRIPPPVVMPSVEVERKIPTIDLGKLKNSISGIPMAEIREIQDNMSVFKMMSDRRALMETQ